MPKAKISLQNRITSLIIISSILFIASFTFIQLNNQLISINRHNTYQANLAGIIAKNNLEAVIRQVEAKDAPAYLESGLKELRNSNMLKDAVIFDPTGKILASADPGLTNAYAGYKDINKAEYLRTINEQEKIFLPEIDKAKRNLNLYVPLRLAANGPLDYVAKISFPLGNIQEAFSAVYKPIIITIILVILANIIFGYILSYLVIGPVKILNEVTKIIARGDLLVRTAIHTNDELQELGETFNYMAGELIKMKERAENANPLTKLPGNIVIREEVEKRIRENQKFVVIYCDLDNFKAFNDKYGIEKGDEAIKLTAGVFKDAVTNKGSAEDFLGHEGGDDFILVTTPEKTQGIADFITREFDRRVRSLYNQEDLTLGHIVAHARDGSIKEFPIMSISLAGVTNEKRPITSYPQVTNIAAELKHKAKEIPGSVFVVDQRTS